MTRQPESKIVNAILDALNALPQTRAKKTHGSRYSVGWPDIVGCHRGRMLALEVKQPGKDATPRQAHELAKWRLAGALVGVVHDVDEALAAIGYPMLTVTSDDLPPIPACGKCGETWECECRQESAVEVRLTADTSALNRDLARVRLGLKPDANW